MNCHPVVGDTSFNTQSYPVILGEIYRILSPWVVFFVLCHQLSSSFGKSMSSSKMEPMDEEKVGNEATKEKEETIRPQEGTVDMYLWYGPWGLLRYLPNPWSIYRQLIQHPAFTMIAFTDSHPVVALFMGIIMATCLVPILSFVGFIVGSCLFGIFSFIFFEGLMLFGAVLALVSMVSCCVCFSALISAIFGAAFFVYQNIRSLVDSALSFASPLLSMIPLGPFKSLLVPSENRDPEEVEEEED